MPLNVLPRRAACLIDGVLLLPAYPAIHVPGLVVSFIAEVGLALWLLVKGVKGRRLRSEPGAATAGVGSAG